MESDFYSTHMCVITKEITLHHTCLFVVSDDEIIEWNEQSLVDCTATEVQQILEMDDSLDLHIVLSRLW